MFKIKLALEGCNDRPVCGDRNVFGDCGDRNIFGDRNVFGDCGDRVVVMKRTGLPKSVNKSP
jgi:hypothetical protein